MTITKTIVNLIMQMELLGSYDFWNGKIATWIIKLFSAKQNLITQMDFNI